MEKNEKLKVILRFGFSYDDPAKISHNEQRYLYEKLCGYGRSLNKARADRNECGLSLDSEVALQTATHHTDLQKALDHFAVICKRVAGLSHHPFTAEIYTYMYENSGCTFIDSQDDYATYRFDHAAFVLQATGEIITPDKKGTPCIEVISGWTD